MSTFCVPVKNILKHHMDHVGIAFSLMQNGEVFMFTGMLDTVADVHQLTIILGHEMAHALLGHSVST